MAVAWTWRIDEWGGGALMAGLAGGGLVVLCLLRMVSTLHDMGMLLLATPGVEREIAVGRWSRRVRGRGRLRRAWGRRGRERAWAVLLDEEPALVEGVVATLPDAWLRELGAGVRARLLAVGSRETRLRLIRLAGGGAR